MSYTEFLLLTVNKHRPYFMAIYICCKKYTHVYAMHMQLNALIYTCKCSTGAPGTPAPLPFGFRYSANSQLIKCFLDSLDVQLQRHMFHCFTQCLHNPCCQAVNITTCEQSYVKTEEMDFVKMVINRL